MSTPMQRGTKALDDMRKSIFDQSVLAIATNLALISEIFTIKKPREIELILTHLNITYVANNYNYNNIQYFEVHNY